MSFEKQKMTQTQNLSQEEAARQKQIDNWLPITSSRNAKWWYSAFHNVTAMVGAGVLSLPSAMAHLGWYVSCLFHFLNGVLNISDIWSLGFERSRCLSHE
jgi:hypothetical protein